MMLISNLPGLHGPTCGIRRQAARPATSARRLHLERPSARRASANGNTTSSEIEEVDESEGVAAAAAERAALALIRSALSGNVEPEDAAREMASVMLRTVNDSNMGCVTLDSVDTVAAQQAGAYAAAERALKQQGGVPEVVFGPGKSPDQIATMLKSIVERQRVALATRITPDMYAALRKIIPGVEYNARARLLTFRSTDADSLPYTERLPGAVAVVSSGSADQAVAEECRLLTEHLGCFCFALPDLGLGNGLSRLLGSLAAIRAADVVVVVCGLDGALASVVAGLVDAPVVAVPTSTGYGATLAGAAPLLAQLSCTTPGVTVVNIDNGFGAAMAARRMLRMAHRLHQTRVTQSVGQTMMEGQG